MHLRTTSEISPSSARGGRSSTRSTIPVETTWTAVSNIELGSGSRTSTTWPRARRPSATLAASWGSPPLLLSTTTCMPEGSPDRTATKPAARVKPAKRT